MVRTLFHVFGAIDTNCISSDHIPISLSVPLIYLIVVIWLTKRPLLSRIAQRPRSDHGNFGLLQSTLEKLTELDNYHDVSVDILDQISTQRLPIV